MMKRFVAADVDGLAEYAGAAGEVGGPDGEAGRDARVDERGVRASLRQYETLMRPPSMTWLVPVMKAPFSEAR